MIIRAKIPVERRVRAVRVSTKHVPQQRLIFEYLRIEGFFVITPSRFGVTFERLGEEKPAQADWERVLFWEGIEVYKWLLALHQWCREQKLDMIFFDCDADKLPGLPTFDW